MFQKVLDILLLNRGLGSIWNKMHSGIQDSGELKFGELKHEPKYVEMETSARLTVLFLWRKVIIRW